MWKPSSIENIVIEYYAFTYYICILILYVYNDLLLNINQYV